MSAAAFVYSQDEVKQLLDLLDSALNTAADIGKPRSSPAQTYSSENPSFSVRNRTGYTVKDIFVNQTGGGDDAVTVSGNVYDRQSVRVKLQSPLSEVSRYSIRMVDESGDSYIKRDVQITEAATIEINIGDLER
jgi:hypothetical protein